MRQLLLLPLVLALVSVAQADEEKNAVTQNEISTPAYLIRTFMNLASFTGRGFKDMWKKPKMSIWSMEFPEQFKADFQQQLFSFIRSAPLLMESRQSVDDSWWDVPLTLLTAWGLSRREDPSCIRKYACQHKMERDVSIVRTLSHWAVTGIGSYYGHDLEPFSGDIMTSRMDTDCQSMEPTCADEYIAQAEAPASMIKNIGGWAYTYYTKSRSDRNTGVVIPQEDEPVSYQVLDESDTEPQNVHYRRRKRPFLG